MKHAMAASPLAVAPMTVALVAVALVAGPALGLQEWDRTAVTSVVSNLAAQTRTLTEALRKDPRVAAGARAGDPNAAGLIESLESLGKTARRLSRSIGDGRGREETLPLATQIRSLVREAEQYGADFATPAWIAEKMAPIDALLGELAPYYFEPDTTG